MISDYQIGRISAQIRETRCSVAQLSKWAARKLTINSAGQTTRTERLRKRHLSLLVAASRLGQRGELFLVRGLIDDSFSSELWPTGITQFCAEIILLHAINSERRSIIKLSWILLGTNVFSSMISDDHYFSIEETFFLLNAPNNFQTRCQQSRP